MLKVEPLSMCGATRVGRCNINLSNEVPGEARVNLPLELSLPADPLQWSKRQTQNWLCWLREANDLELLDITQFNVDGPGLCSLSPQIIEGMVGIRAGNIFRSTLDMLQSTAALVRHSPPAEQIHSNFQTTAALVRHSPPAEQIHSNFQTTAALVRHSPPAEQIHSNFQTTAALVRHSPPAEQIHSPFQTTHFSPEHKQTSPNQRQLTPEEEKGSAKPCQLVKTPTSPALTTSPPPLSLHHTDRLPLPLPLHYQTPGEVPSYNRSSVITFEDIARLQPIAGVNTEHIASSLRPPHQDQSTDPAAKIERRRSSDSSVEGEEDKLNRKYFLNIKTERRPSSNGIDCGRQGVTLWQFILELLADESCQEIVTWTENHLEFKVINSKEMAIRWGNRKNRPKMNYDKLSRALRYYYRKNLIQHVPGKRQVYFFVEHPESLDFTQLLNNALATHPIRSRKPSAFTHVSSRKRPHGGVPQHAQPDILSEMKKVRTIEPLSMLGYKAGHGPAPQLLTLQSPLIAQHLPKLLLQQGSLDLLRQGDRISLPLEELMMSSAVSSASNTMMTSSNNPPLMSALMTQLPPRSIPTDDVLHNISVLDTGCVKRVY